MASAASLSISSMRDSIFVGRGTIYSAYMRRVYCHTRFYEVVLAIIETLVFIMDDIVSMPIL